MKASFGVVNVEQRQHPILYLAMTDRTKSKS